MGTPASSPLKDIYFDFDRADLRADARETLKANAQWLKDNPAATVQIEGHCDERGTAEYNLELSQKRAQAAIDYLKSVGIPARRLEAVGLGESMPAVVCDCDSCTEEQHQKNRRTTFKIID